LRTGRLRRSAGSEDAEAEKERRRHSVSESSAVSRMDESG
jgi:hypothetical protein